MTGGFVDLYRSADPWHQKIRGAYRVWLPDGPLPDGRVVVGADAAVALALLPRRLSTQAILDIDDRDHDAYRVTVVGRTDGQKVALFRGPGALECAIDYASTCFDSWADPFDLAKEPK